MNRALTVSAVVLLTVLAAIPLVGNDHQLRSAAQVPVVCSPADLNASMPAARAAVEAGAATQPVVVTYKAQRGQPGYWRLGQVADGTWWFVAPDGRQEFLNGVTTVQPFQLGRDRDGAEYVSRDFNGRRGQTDGADVRAWAAASLGRIREVGFKALGAWSHPAFHELDVPMTRDLNITTYMHGAGLKLYSRDWPALAERVVQQQVAPLAGNRNLVGYYLDNELDWGDTVIGPAVHFDNLAAQDPNRQEVVRVMQTVWGEVGRFNADWKTNIVDWADIAGWQTLPHAQREPYARLFTAWLSHMAEDYFKLTTALVRKHDPNHLILGVRFKAFAPPEVVRASRGHTDAQSLNVYPGDARLDPDAVPQMYELSGQPIIISEYAFHSLDGRSGNRNTVGFMAQVLDQKARADAYELFTSRVARVPYVVGADWFQWMDEPPSGRTLDGEDVNFGVVDIDDRPYELLAEAVRRTAPRLNALHAASYADERRDVWRESFAEKPAMAVPFLSKAPVLNGELRDWPAEARLHGVRHSQTVGLERSTIPLPNVLVGWTLEGLYIGMEVFDNDIQAAPARGMWWSRDCVEFWLSSRVIPQGQGHYDETCHQFFFVPMDAPADDRYTGCVGQWHRPGDGLKESLVPHPQIRSSTRVLHDRYVVEMFLPAGVLKGFDPKAGPRQLGFNFHVRNYQHALDYFWSAPKEKLTQLRPNTWGTLDLRLPEDRVVQAAASGSPTTQPVGVTE